MRNDPASKLLRLLQQEETLLHSTQLWETFHDSTSVLQADPDTSLLQL
jgi:hypothetical protein